MRLTLTSTAALLAADTETRRLRGVAIPYGVYGNTSAGRLCVDAGAVAVPENLRTVKLFTEHGRQTPTGYAVQVEDRDENLAMEFSVARTPDGDRALLEAAEGVRDALSVELDNITIEAGHVVAADLVAVAQVALPAFAGAQLVAALTDDQQAEVNDLAQQIVDATAPEETPPPEDAAATTTEQETSMTSTETETTAAARGVSQARLWASQVAQVMTGARDAAQVNAALADITPSGSGTDDLFPRPGWIDELWHPQAMSRPVVDAIGVSALTAMTMQGWKWETEPDVAPYAGNKAEVPSNQASIVPAEAPASRVAGGWDLDRIYLDFNTGFIEAFQQAAIRSYRKRSQEYFIDGHAAVVGPPAVPAHTGILADATDLGTQTSAMAAINAVVSFLAGNGARVSFLVMASDVYAAFLELDGSSAPWWLPGQGNVSLGGSADVAGTAIAVDPAMASGTVLGGDRDAVTLWETGPVNVTAVNLPNGGIDLALFGYLANLVHDDDGLAKATATITAAATAPTAKKTTSSSS